MADELDTILGKEETKNTSEKPKKERKKRQGKKQQEASTSSIYDESDQFSSGTDDDDSYGQKQEGQPAAEDAVSDFQHMFGFKWWEIGVLLVEVVLIIYLVLVLTRVVPLF